MGFHGRCSRGFQGHSRGVSKNFRSDPGSLREFQGRSRSFSRGFRGFQACVIGIPAVFCVWGSREFRFHRFPGAFKGYSGRFTGVQGLLGMFQETSMSFRSIPWNF